MVHVRVWNLRTLNVQVLWIVCISPLYTAGFISVFVPGVCKLTKRFTNMRFEISPLKIARSQLLQGGIIF